MRTYSSQVVDGVESAPARAMLRIVCSGLLAIGWGGGVGYMCRLASM